MGSYSALVRAVVSCLKSQPAVEVVGTATNGRRGLVLAKELKPDLIVTQFNMPDMTGPALTRAVKSNGASPIVIIISVKNLPARRILAQQAGADVYLPRSELDELSPLVRKLTERMN